MLLSPTPSPQGIMWAMFSLGAPGPPWEELPNSGKEVTNFWNFRSINLISWFYKWGKRCPKRLNDRLKGIQTVSVWTEAVAVSRENGRPSSETTSQSIFFVLFFSSSTLLKKTTRISTCKSLLVVPFYFCSDPQCYQVVIPKAADVSEGFWCPVDTPGPALYQPHLIDHIALYFPSFTKYICKLSFCHLYSAARGLPTF